MGNHVGGDVQQDNDKQGGDDCQRMREMRGEVQALAAQYFTVLVLVPNALPNSSCYLNAPTFPYR